MADLSFLVDDEEAGIFKSDDVITSTELERLEVDEELTGFNRAIFLLTKGLPIQQESALAMLPTTLAYHSTDPLDLQTLSETLTKMINDHEEDVIETEAENSSTKASSFRTAAASTHPFSNTNKTVAVLNTVLELITADSQGRSTIRDHHYADSSSSRTTNDGDDPIEEMWHQYNASTKGDKDIKYLLTNAQVTDLLLPIGIQYLEGMSDHIPPLREASSIVAATVVEYATKRLSKPASETPVISVAMKKGDLSQPIISRMACSKILGAVAAHGDLHGGEVESLFLSKLVELFQDTDARVRQCTCEQLQVLARAVGRDTAGKELLPELLELLIDEETDVKLQAFHSMVGLLDFFTPEDVSSQILPVLIPLVTDPPEEYVCAIAKSFGVIVHKLHEVTTSTSLDSFIEAYFNLSMKTTNDTNIEIGNTVRYYCAFNFPAILQAASSSSGKNAAKTLDEIVKVLSRDSVPRIRECVAGIIPQVATLSGPERTLMILKPLFISLLQDETTSVASKAFENLSHLISYFSDIPDETEKSTCLSDIISATVRHNASLPESCWRRQLSLLNVLQSYPKWFDPLQLHEHIVPIICSRMSESSALPVQKRAADLFVYYIRSNTNQSQRHMSITKMCNEFGSGTCAWQRRLFLAICGSAMSYNSRLYACRNYLNHASMFKMLQDPVPNIRIATLGLYPTLHAAILAEKEALPEEFVARAEEFFTIYKTMDETECDRDVKDAIRQCQVALRKDDTSDKNNAAKAEEETRREMDTDCECTTTAEKFSDMFEYTFTVNKDGTVARRTRVKSIEGMNGTSSSSSSSGRGSITIQGATNTVASTVSSTKESKRRRNSKITSQLLPTCPGSTPPRVAVAGSNGTPRSKRGSVTTPTKGGTATNTAATRIPNLPTRPSGPNKLPSASGSNSSSSSSSAGSSSNSSTTSPSTGHKERSRRTSIGRSSRNKDRAQVTPIARR